MKLWILGDAFVWAKSPIIICEFFFRKKPTGDYSGRERAPPYISTGMGLWVAMWANTACPYGCMELQRF
jgi:hypothetical protein